MKVNLKKIGAIVAGATILASSVAFAGLMFQNTELVNAQGNPTVKVVLGEKAAASDGVAAANIAAAIASNSWKSTVFTAAVSGDATCAVGGGATTGGTCAISNEKAKLEITVPGSATPGTYTLKSLVADLTDRTLLDRGQGSLTVYNMTTAETSDESHPFTQGGQAATGLSGVSNEELFRIDGTMFEPFQEATILDNDAGKTYKERQSIFVNTHSQYRDTFDAVGGRFKDFIYQIKFTHDQYGIPVCTKSNSSSWEYGGGACTTTSTDATQNHKVKIKFLGGDWVLTKVDNPTTTILNETNVVSGGEINLAKESVGGIVNVGDSLDAGNGLKIRLDDIKEGTTATEQSAIISVVDANGAVIKQTTVTPGTTQTISTAGGVQTRVRVFKTAPGYTFGAKWADMSVISNELVLKDGDVVEANGDRDKNDKWKVRLGWKNRDTGAVNTSDHLRTILLYRDISDFFRTGEGYNVIEDPLGFKFTYRGLDLNPASSEDYDTLRYEFVDLGTSGFNYVADGSTSTTRESNASGYVRITSGVSGAFASSVGTGRELRVLLQTDGALSWTGNVTKTAISGFSSRPSLIPGDVIMKLEGTPERWVSIGNITSFDAGPSNVLSNNTYQDIQYSIAGAPATVSGGGALRIGWGLTGNTSHPALGWQSVSGGANFTPTGVSLAPAATALLTGAGGLVILLSEESGEGQSASKPDAIAAFFNITAKSFNKDSPNSRYLKDKCTVASASNFSSTRASHDLEGSTSMPTQREVNYITHRGTICKELSDTVFTLKVPKQKVAHPQYVLSTAEASASAGSGYQATLGEGESYTVPGTGGVVVKVKEITEDVGACGVGAGGAPACTVDSSGLSALVLADGRNPRASYEGSTMGTVSNLVVLDRDAVGADVLVSVGGPAVNAVTKSLLEGASINFETDRKVVREIVPGKKIIVAGLTADDTLTAARDFIADLKRQ